MRTYRLAYLVSHPIQYQAPLLRRISEQPDIELKVFFRSRVAAQEYFDPGFGRKVSWDVDLLSGYEHEFLPTLGDADKLSWWRPVNLGIGRKIRQGGFDVLWVHGYADVWNLAAVAAAKRCGMKVLLRDEATTLSKQRSILRGSLKRAFFGGLSRYCDAFLAIGTLNAQYFQQQGIDPERVFVLPYSVDNEFFQNRAAISSKDAAELKASLNLEAERPVVLYASKMTERKRAEDLLEAYGRLSPDGSSEPRPYLLFIGDGEMRPQLERRAQELGWDSVRFLGFKNQTELPRYYRISDVFVLPSVFEPWGLVVNEVMNAGCAVIVSDQVGCAPDLVKNGENGCVYAAGDVAQLSDALRRVTESAQLQESMGRRSLELINAWDYARFIDGLRQALHSVLP